MPSKEKARRSGPGITLLFGINTVLRTLSLGVLVRIRRLDRLGWLVFEGLRYSWEDIESVDELDFININAGAAKYRAQIYLKVGSRIHQNGRAPEKAGVKPNVGFLTTRSDAFDELLAIFKSHAI